MLLALIYAIVRALLDLLLVRLWRVSAADIEVLALRHEARMRRSSGQRRVWRPGDRLLLAALSRCLPRREWGLLPVHPDTLVRRHRALSAGKCPQAGRRGPSTAPPTRPASASARSTPSVVVGHAGAQARAEQLAGEVKSGPSGARATPQRRGMLQRRSWVRTG